MTIKNNPYYEKYGGMFLGFLTAIVAYFFLKPLYNEKWEHFISTAFYLACAATIYLGFMLLLNYNVETAQMRKIRCRELLYKHIIRHNTQVLILAIAVSLYSAFAVGFNNYEQPEVLQKLILSGIVFLLVWLFIDGFNLTRIYYMIFKKYNKIT